MQRNNEKHISVNSGVYVTRLTTHIMIFFYIFVSILFYYRDAQSKIIQCRLSACGLPLVLILGASRLLMAFSECLLP